MLRRLMLVLVISVEVILATTAIRSNQTLAQTAAQYIDRNPSWSPDGETIAFEAIRLEDYEAVFGQPDPGDYDIWTMNPDGTDLVNLTSDSPAMDREPSWSPDSQMIVFVSNRSGDLDVWVMNPGGSNATNITTFKSGHKYEPSWSPDGQWIAYIAENTEGVSYDVWIVKPDGTNPTKLTSWENHIYGSVTWSPDSNAVAVTSLAIEPHVNTLEETLQNPEVSKPDGVWVFSIDGAEPIHVTSNRRDIEVAWSPYGDLLATTVLNGLDNTIWLVDTSGSNLVDLSQVGFAHSPVWSPSGHQIAFTSRRQGTILTRDIWVMDSGDTNPVNLTDEIGFVNIQPSWSPDGTQIAFESNPANPSSEYGFSLDADIWVMNSDGTNPVNLTEDHQ